MIWYHKGQSCVTNAHFYQTQQGKEFKSQIKSQNLTWFTRKGSYTINVKKGHPKIVHIKQRIVIQNLIYNNH